MENNTLLERTKENELSNNNNEILIQKYYDSLTEIDKLRFDTRKKLLNILKPLLQEYMKQNDIKIVVDRKTVVLVENNLDISQKAIELLNGKVKTLNIK